VVLLGVLGVVSGLALASSGPPSPAITSHPVSPTAAASASFAFNDSVSKVTFVCSLDASSFSACSSPNAYGGLAPGSHTFRVEAKDTAGKTSAPTSFVWTIDQTPPNLGLTFPASGSSYGTTGWNAGCARGPGVCGTASDPSGVSAAAVSIRQNATGKYWGGGGYSSSSELYGNATLSMTSTGASWRYALPLPSPDGSYTLHVKATDGLGNQTASGSPATSVFTIDTVAPPAPSITTTPANPSNQTVASFGFADPEGVVVYACRLDGGAYSACASPKTYSGITQGAHTFSVEAIDAAGNTSSRTTYSWVIDTTPPPTPTITQHPTDPTSSSTVTFAFDDSEAGVSFECRLDVAAWTPCSSPTTYTGLGAGPHDFYVRAVDAAANHSGSAHFDFDVRQQTAQPFTITGNAPKLLYPGAGGVAIAVRLSNPNSAPISVTSLTVVVQATTATTCSASWFSIIQPTISGAGVQVPANGSVTLPAPGATAPSIMMIDSHTNQNACVGAKLTLSYTGNAHS